MGKIDAQARPSVDRGWDSITCFARRSALATIYLWHHRPVGGSIHQPKLFLHHGGAVPGAEPGVWELAQENKVFYANHYYLDDGKEKVHLYPIWAVCSEVAVGPRSLLLKSWRLLLTPH